MPPPGGEPSVGVAPSAVEQRRRPLLDDERPAREDWRARLEHELERAVVGPPGLDAIAARDGERAKQAMTGHLELARKLYGRDFDRSLDQLARRELERSPDPWTSLEAILGWLGAEQGK